MPIRIASQPIGTPIIAAASTAVAQANERRGALQARMFEDEQRRKAIQDERQADREFQLQRDKTAADEAEKRRLADVEEFDRRDAAYRRKDALGSLYDEIARREKFYSSTPLTPDGMKQRDAMAQKLREIREAEARGYRPNEMIGFYSQWIEEFDKQNPSAWEDKPKPTIDEFSRNSMYAGPDGRIIPNDSVLSGGAVPGYSRTMDPSTGKWGPWEKWAGAGGVDDKEAGTKLKWAQDQVNKWISENDMGAGVNQEAYDKMLREQLNEYDRLQAMVRSGAYKDGQPGQPAPQQPGQPQPSPAGDQQVAPGRGQALPIPTAPYQPPTQPLNAGDIVLPGGPSQLAPPPRDYAAEVAAQQAQYGGGQPGSMTDFIRNTPGVDDGMMHYKDGKPVDKFGKPVRYGIDDGVQYYDSQGRPLDNEGFPVEYVNDGKGNIVPRRLSDTPTGKASTTYLEPDAAPGGAPLDQKGITDTIDRARASDPQNAAMYDEAAALLGKPKDKMTQDDVNKLFQIYLRAQASGLGMNQ